MRALIALAALVAAPAVGSAGPTFLSDDAWVTEPGVWTITARPSWDRGPAGGDGWRLGAELEYGIDERWQVEVDAARSGGPPMTGLPSTTEAEASVLVRVAGDDPWGLAVGAAAITEVVDGEAAVAIEPSLRASVETDRWGADLLVAAEAPTDAPGDAELCAAIAGAVKLGALRPLLEGRIARDGGELVLSWRAGAALELGSFELATALGRDDGGALSVQALVAWDVGGEDVP